MHALLLEGTYEWAITEIEPVFRIEGPDVQHLVKQRMVIDDVRTLTHHAFKTPLVLKERAFIISVEEMTHEAQNAFLKLLEEPPQTARFFIVTERADELLPTLRSRLIRFRHETAEEASHIYDAFIRGGFADRLSMIADRMAKKDDAWANGLMRAFDQWAHTHEDRTFLKALMETRQAFTTQGASKKMILEHLALLLPTAEERML